ncbi:hypothetical protein PAMC26510_31085 [Caballeronia sordidicola]|uniref:Uncharacterized protein n=1 Tax=Caballeronia sordidicola TaxID=196367 RepID=A0A242M8F9_CABSO|nr:hypothetical protein PAMC26510_31085 [Caballeronia sordidicola]
MVMRVYPDIATHLAVRLIIGMKDDEYGIVVRQCFWRRHRDPSDAI